ncbi:MAG: hypothetical protein HYV52_00800 [Parcubacteria group bacterium]|nr:hypothetical protein [Parcubacteria group bacterium]
MKFYYKIIIVLFVVFVAIDAYWVFSKYKNIQRDVYEARKEKTVAKVLEKTKDLVQPEHFTDPDFKKNASVFENLFESLRTPEFFRVKIWNADYRVIWSNLTEIIGSRAPENDEVKEALSGEVAFELKSLKPEQITERDFPNFSETYVPIKDEAGKVVGVVEAYQASTIVDLTVQSELQTVVRPIIFGSLILFLVLAVILRFIYK